ncbi:alpha-amylase [Rubrobacter xylanophilus]|uniref:Alpha-amylase n=1 Tax=Rubrobacter xylanophilus TaxID=49319 RepID=A0A510HPB0_9ACTN|nr:alpha-amylase family glycosyl hydrolase [Rubrobacter xylanophilus]BBL80567.1 alpha-amylase [Rubrobacter xylanophilus]
MTEGRKHSWWQRGVIYHIYPRSFQDTNGDGVGDLRGVTQRLDYLQWLGVDALWLSPFYPSPMADFGYDITDHCNVDPLFGTLENFDELLEEAHRLGLRVIVDYVPNHTSDEHPWFVESRSSRESPKRDWYIWEDPKPDGSPPNNWLSVFGGPAWEWDERTEQYYYHAFHRKQPDLNWRNPEVREAMYGVMRFWLKRGVDGFRVDALRHLVKDEELRDNPPNPDYQEGRPSYETQLPVYTTDRPEVHRIISGMRRVLDGYGADRVMIGELYLPFDRLVLYYGEDGRGVHLPTNMHLITTPWSAPSLAALVSEYEAALPPYGWPNWVLGNHDNPRIATRIGPEKARAAAVLLLTLRGTPTMYYGDEIGMSDGKIPPEHLHDPAGEEAPHLGRDPARTPMQWSDTPNAGFCPPDTRPWLPLSSDHRRRNVAVQRLDPHSILSLYRRLLRLRRSEPALSIGSYEPLEATSSLLAYARSYAERRLLIALNLGDAPTSLPRTLQGRILLSTSPQEEGHTLHPSTRLFPGEALVVAP